MRRLAPFIPLLLIAAIAWADSVHQYRPQPVGRVTDPLTRQILTEMDRSIGSVVSTVNTVVPVAGGGSYEDVLFSIYDDGDPTKLIQFNAAAIATATTRTVAVPNQNGTLALVDGYQTWSSFNVFSNGSYFNDSLTSSSVLLVDGTGGGSFQTKVFNAGLDGLFYFYDGAGNDYTVQLSGVPFSGNVVLTLPSSGGTMVSTSAVQTLLSKTLAVGCNLNCNTATGVNFRDNSDQTKTMRWDLSGITTGTTRNVKWLNDAGTLPVVTAPTSATTDKTGQTASIGATTVYTTTHAGFYRLNAYAVVTAVTIAGALTVTALYTDPQQAQTNAFISAIAYTVAGNYDQGSCVFYATTGSVIQFSTTLTGTATYSVYVRVEDLS